MLGNFSFGDYFKEEAIKFSWELLTKVFELPKDKLLVTVHYTDEEAARLWNKIAGIPDSEIIRLDKDNFWAMGDTGPCGPSTEIFFDYGDSVSGGKPGTPDEDGDRYVEIYNNVFMQNFRDTVGGKLKELRQKNIDTGMGLERIASVLQNKHSNYDTDTFINLKNFASDLFKIKITGENINAFNVCSDHIRAVSFAIADGIIPSNEGRGYVIRKIIRRAMRYINLLGVKDICFYKLADAVEREMGEYYTELTDHLLSIKAVIQTEEKLFMESLHKGTAMLDDMVKDIKTGGVLPGHLAFKLYDTYGFPLDMTEDILRSRNIAVDVNGFNNEMKLQKEKSKLSGKSITVGSFESSSLSLVDQKVIQNIKRNFGNTEFVGYEQYDILCKLLDFIKLSNTKFAMVTNKTPFYAESGGQVSDTGVFILDGKIVAQVRDVKKIDGIFIHFVEVVNDFTPIKGLNLIAEIDSKRRSDITKNHTCVHLLQSALIEVLGDHIKQKGSFVCDKYARFDFINPRALKSEELQNIERLINDWINRKLSVSKIVLPIDEAKKIGAIAPFGEKYGNIVRVVKIGNISTEFCGGTHLNNISEIEYCILDKEESVAAGIRRITIITGDAAYSKLKSVGAFTVQEYRKILLDLESKKQSEIIAKKQAIKDEEIKKVNLELEKLYLSTKSEKINNIKLCYVIHSNISHKAVHRLFQRLKNDDYDQVCAVFITELDKKVSISIAITDSLKNKMNLKEIIKKLSEMCGGKGGGGSDTFVSFGGSYFDKSAAIIEEVKKILKSCC